MTAPVQVVEPPLVERARVLGGSSVRLPERTPVIRPAPFRYDPVAGVLTWSDGMFELYGHRPGSVLPTLRLLREHEHPDDRERSATFLREALQGSRCSWQHRIVTAAGAVRHVVCVLDPRHGANGRVQVLHGFTYDVTGARTSLEPPEFDAEGAQRVIEQLREAIASRDVIAQAKGLLLAWYRLDDGAAFAWLSRMSQDRNRKVRDIATALVEAANHEHRSPAAILDEVLPPARPPRTPARRRPATLATPATPTTPTTPATPETPAPPHPSDR